MERRYDRRTPERSGMVVLACSRIAAYGKDLQGVFNRLEAELLAHLALDGVESFFLKFENTAAFRTDQVIVVRHFVRQFEMCTALLEAVFHQNIALGQQIESRIDRCSGYLEAAASHPQIKFVGTEMLIHIYSAFQHEITFLSVAVLLFAKITGKSLSDVIHVNGRLFFHTGPFPAISLDCISCWQANIAILRLNTEWETGGGKRRIGCRLLVDRQPEDDRRNDVRTRETGGRRREEGEATVFFIALIPSFPNLPFKNSYLCVLCALCGLISFARAALS